MDYTFQFNVVLKALPDLLSGAAVSLSLAVASMIIGMLLAAPLSVAAAGSSLRFKGPARSWIEIARNTPCLAQIYAMYYGLGAIGIFMPAWAAVLLAISFNNAGYLAEIFRGGLNGVNANQFKAGRSLGFTSAGAYTFVVFPQVIRNTFNSIGNQFIWALLNTSLGALIGLYDLSGVAMDYQMRTFKTFEFFLAIAVAYIILAKLIMFGMRFLKPKGAGA